MTNSRWQLFEHIKFTFSNVKTPQNIYCYRKAINMIIYRRSIIKVSNCLDRFILQ